MGMQIHKQIYTFPITWNVVIGNTKQQSIFISNLIYIKYQNKPKSTPFYLRSELRIEWAHESRLKIKKSDTRVYQIDSCTGN